MYKNVCTTTVDPILHVLQSSYCMYDLQAACRHQCQYLIKVHKEEFLRCMGQEIWLEGQINAAQKIRDIDVINRLLAHRPWLLQASHLQVRKKTSNYFPWFAFLLI